MKQLALSINGVDVPYPSDANFRYANQNLGTIIHDLIPYFFGFAGFVMLLMIVAAGFSLMTSAGDPKKLQAGQQRLLYAIVGFIVIFAAYWIVQAAGYMLGFTTITSSFQ